MGLTLDVAAAAVAEVVPDQGQNGLVLRVVLIQGQIRLLLHLGIEDQVTAAAVHGGTEDADVLQHGDLALQGGELLHYLLANGLALQGGELGLVVPGDDMTDDKSDPP